MPARRPAMPFPDAAWAEAIRHEGLVRDVARRHLGRGLELDDLVQEGLIGVCRAVELNRGDPATWPRHCANWANHAMQRAVAEGALVRRGFRESRTRADGVTLEGFDEIPCPPDRVDAEAWAEVVAALATLDGRQRRAIELRYLDGLSLREAGREMGLSYQSVANAERAALARLAATLGDPDASRAGRRDR